MNTPFSAIALVLLVMASGQAELTDVRVKASMNAGVRFLISRQQEDGSWPNTRYAIYHPGVTSLCTLALLNAGLTPEDPPVRKALSYLLQQSDSDKTYAISLQTIVFCLADPQTYQTKIRANVSWLQKAQHTKDPKLKGSWGYGMGRLREDPSNAQFALLALYEAERVGVPVRGATWRLALDYWKRTQRKNGSFAYEPEKPSTGSMTCAGIGSMIIASGQIGKLDASVQNGKVVCCGNDEIEDETEQAIERALEWLGKNFSVKRNPTTRRVQGFPSMYHYYYLYALERTGRLAGRRFIGEHDWYREGVEELLSLQDKLSGFWNNDEPLTCTAFAVLFLAKGRRPILLSKVKRLPADDWNRHRHDVAHLTHHVEKRWKQELTWQVIDWSNAAVDDLWQSPVLFISGRDALTAVEREKTTLREYIRRGGFVFAENCCEGDGFDRDFRALMKELFPETALRLLPQDHPVWFAEQKVDPKYLRRLEGLDACCRTGVVYCPENLSCYWELAKPKRSSGKELPAEVRQEVDACLAIGANVLTYATGRELKQKLDTSGLVSVVKTTERTERGALQVAKLQHKGGSDDAPAALGNILSYVGKQTQLPVSLRKQLLSPVDPSLPEYPIAFLHGRRSFRWSPAERKAIRRFVENGGVILADAICASEEFKSAFHREMSAIFPNQPLRRIPPNHPMFSSLHGGHQLETVAVREPRSRANRGDPLSIRTTEVAPFFEGIQLDGRFVVLFSPYDMSCALENRPSLECRGYTSQDAARLATNLILYAVQQ